MIQEPESLYLDDSTPNSGRADDISKEPISLIQERNSVTSLIALCCDGAPVNTGTNSGVIQGIELDVNKPLQWLDGQLHLNELPFRAPISRLDGATSGST